MLNKTTCRLALLALFAFAIQSAFALEIALIGDVSKRSAFQKLVQELKLKPAQGRNGNRATSIDLATTITLTAPPDNAIAAANQLHTADLAFLVVDATQGPLPVVREQLIVARQARIPGLVIYFSNTAALLAAAPKDAPELLELEEMEMRELLGNYEMGGEKAVVLFDGDVRQIHKSSFAKGSSEVPRFLASYAPRRPVARGLRPITELKCQLYLLSNPEANGKGITLKDKSGIETWLEGQSGKGTVQASKPYRPGDVGELVLRLATPLQGVEGSRILLLKNGATVGLGVVEKIVR